LDAKGFKSLGFVDWKVRHQIEEWIKANGIVLTKSSQKWNNLQTANHLNKFVKLQIIKLRFMKRLF